MSVLKYLETNFNKQTRRIKIELVLFPFIIFFTIIFSINESKNLEFINDIKIEISDTFNNITMESKIVDILNDLENFINTNKIQLNKISNNNQSIKIEIEADLNKQLFFIKFIEDYNSFSKIKYLRQEKNLLLVEIVFEKLYMKNSIDLKKNLISFETYIDTKLKLFAIVDNSVLINNRWLKVEDTIASFRITDIKENSVSLNNGFKILKLKIYKNENN